jgi:hypothetical protein
MDNLNVVKQINIEDKLYDLNSKYWGGLEPTDKQDTLISGSNIKTINGQSILGEGDITISGGSSNANVQAVDTQETIDDVYDGGVVKYTAQSLTDEQKAQVRQNIGLSNIINSVKLNGISNTPTNGEIDLGQAVSSVKINGFTYTPTNGLVDLGTIESGGSGGGSGSNEIEWEEMDGFWQQGYISVELNPVRPNKVYISPTVSVGVISFSNFERSNVFGDIYTVIFMSPSTYPTSINFPTDFIVTYSNGNIPTFELDTMYEISIIYTEFNNNKYLNVTVTPFL